MQLSMSNKVENLRQLTAIWRDPDSKCTFQHSLLPPHLSSCLPTPDLLLLCFILSLLGFLLQARWSSSSMKLRKILADVRTPYGWAMLLWAGVVVWGKIQGEKKMKNTNVSGKLVDIDFFFKWATLLSYISTFQKWRKHHPWLIL